MLPYVTAPGSVTKALAGIQATERPARVNADFIHNVLHIPGSSGRQIGTWLKRTGFVGVDELPTALYDRFKLPGEARAAAGEALRIGYAPLFMRSADALALPDDQLHRMIQEEMKLGLGSNVVTLILACFKALRTHAVQQAGGRENPASPARFAPAGSGAVQPALQPSLQPFVRIAMDPVIGPSTAWKGDVPPAGQGGTIQITPSQPATLSGLKASAAYTIYLSLPATNDATVFSAIFQSLKDTLLS